MTFLADGASSTSVRAAAGAGAGAGAAGAGASALRAGGRGRGGAGAFGDGGEERVDADGRAFGGDDLAQRAGGGGGNLDRHLVGFEFAQHLVERRPRRPAS